MGSALVRRSVLERRSSFDAPASVYFIRTTARGLEDAGGDELGSIFSKALKGIGHVASNVGKTVAKAVKDTGHEVGRVASNPLVQKATAVGLAFVPGVGPVAAASILAAEKGGGALLAPHGTIGKAATGAATGALEGAGSAVAGSVLRKLPGVANIENTVTHGAASLFQRVAGASAPAASDAQPIDTPAPQLPPVSVTPAASPAVGSSSASSGGGDSLFHYGPGSRAVQIAERAISPANNGGNVSGTLLSHLIGTKNAEAVQQVGRVLTGQPADASKISAATGPVAQLFQRVASPIASVGAEASSVAEQLAPAPVVTVPPPGAGGILEAIKAHPVAAGAAVVGVVLLLRAER